jgi:hypothetical protein
MSVVMGDSFTACSGKDWIERTEWDDKGYFSWILQPSASLLAVIQSVSNIYLQGSTEDCCPLIYVLHSMALQRLVDLNRQIKSLEYLLQNNDNLLHNNLVVGAALSPYRKKSRKWERHISLLRQEAAGLTDFMMGHLWLLANDQQSISSDDATCMDISVQALHETEEWDFGICTVNKKSLPTAIWWILCQNIDIWCTHAAKKKLKLFLSLLIRTSLPSLRSSFVKVRKQHNNELSQLKKVTINQISSELLSDSIFYEQKVRPLSNTPAYLCTDIHSHMLYYSVYFMYYFLQNVPFCMMSSYFYEFIGNFCFICVHSISCISLFAGTLHRHSAMYWRNQYHCYLEIFRLAMLI